MFPVVLATATFGDQWAGKVVQFVVDNMAVVEVINVTYSKDLHMMHLIRLLVIFVYNQALYLSILLDYLSSTLSIHPTRFFINHSIHPSY